MFECEHGEEPTRYVRVDKLEAAEQTIKAIGEMISFDSELKAILDKHNE